MVADGVPVLLHLNPKIAAKQLKVWSRPEVALAHRDEVGNVQDRVGPQVVHLAPVEEPEPTHKAVKWEPEPGTKELLMQHSLIADRHRHILRPQ